MKASPKQHLLSLGPQRTFSGLNLSQIVFPLGGIGTGSVGLTGRGGLKDWEIFNRPNFGSTPAYTFPIIFAKERGSDPICRMLMAPPSPPYVGHGGGEPHHQGEGFPHMDACTFRGEYPFAYIDFTSKRLPVKVSLEAYNPFIPSDADASGYPAAILKYTVANKRKAPVDVTIAWSMLNLVGSLDAAEHDAAAAGIEFGLGQNVNEYIDAGNVRGLLLTSRKWPAHHPRYGSMALVTPDKNVTYTTHWSREPWFTPRHDFWDTFSTTGKPPQHTYGPSDEGRSDAGVLGVRVRLQPGQSKTITFYITWYFPTFEKYWHVCTSESGCCSKSAPKPTWKNYYANQFSDALDVARKLHAHERDLYARTKSFHDALFSSTFPPYALDAVSSQIGILKTATCIRLEDGTFYGFEGCSTGGGCCEGSCTHVWNYQQALPFLFPALERSMRSADYAYNFRDDGGMCFRLQLPLGSSPNDFHACADGQMGGVLKTYRDWRISGDDAWLKSLWPSVRRALEYAWVKWDSDKDGVMDGIQHNTYDIEFLGPNPLMATLYLGALVAGAEMADFVGDTAAASEYRAVYERGRNWIDTHLFNGEYYIQKYSPKAAPRYQFGAGCLSDALLGQWLASLCGLGPILDEEHVRKTLQSIVKYNWRPSLSEHSNAQRVYALNDEAGLLLCSWPRGGRPAIPFPYSDEVWTGIEYQVAAHCIMEGFITEGLTIVKALRNRHDGFRRNPWDEFECGHHYARAMASYGLLLALSGFTYDKGAGILGFSPRIHTDRFKTFWALDGVWGTYAQERKRASIHVLSGIIALTRIDLPGFAPNQAVRIRFGNRTIRAEADAFGSITLARALTLRPGQRLLIER